MLRPIRIPLSSLSSSCLLKRPFHSSPFALSHRIIPRGPRTSVPIGKTSSPSTTPSTPHPYIKNDYNPWIRFGTFAIGAAVGLAYVYIAVYADAQEPELVESTAGQVAAARKHLGLYIWGNAVVGTVDVLFPGQVLRDVAFGIGHAAAVDADGNLMQWSTPPLPAAGSKSKTAGEFTPAPPAPRLTVRGKGFVQAACTNEHVFALCRNGDLYAVEKNAPAAAETGKGWFTKAGGEEGPVVTKLAPPTSMKRGEKVVKIAAGADFVGAVTSRGRALTLQGTSWTELPELTDVQVSDIACGEKHTLISTVDGRVFGCGSNAFGQLATDTSISSVANATEISTLWSPPRQAAKPTNTRCSKIAAGGNTSLFVVETPTSTKVMGCGTGMHGQLGTGAFPQVAATPGTIKALTDLSEWVERDAAIKPIRIRSIAAAPGGTHCAAVLENSVASSDKISRGWWLLSWFTGESKGRSSAVQDSAYGYDALVWGGNTCGQLARADEKRGNTAIPVHSLPVEYADQTRRTAGRLQIAPPGEVIVGNAGKSTKAIAEQQLVLGPGLTGVFMKLVT
ncbi:hypothetical protein HDU87_002495 [Geranomyces variabilis]|uniref:Uncharacterized protein n=1 Tax=Geranomyces variabilis TaxID=109894 RepID=A0AAD5TR91_9FUNG|nr:hypothetical protein HDU87_002495 [Geranomyces variabilis]